MSDLPKHAADSHTEGMAVIYKRALVLDAAMASGDVPKALRRQVSDILTICRFYLQPSRTGQMDHEQRSASRG